MNKIYSKDTLCEINIKIDLPCIIFLYGDLGAGKTTLSQILIRKILGNNQVVTSPTYVYYNKYKDIYHFDLYRIESYDEFVSIGGEEILDNNSGVILVEWPEKIDTYYKADIELYLRKTDKIDEREIEVMYKKKA